MKWTACLCLLGVLEASEPGADPVPGEFTAPSPLEGINTDLGESETHEFRAETDRLLEIIIGSLYSERDVFIRELVSNAADALERLRVESLKNATILRGASGKTYDESHILVQLDKARNEISVLDSGIGMTKNELEDNLGTVAKSGTNNFVEAAKRGASASNLIGQFGVGFYSAFLVADKVTVVSKSPVDPDQHIWQSKADGKYKISTHRSGNSLERGTTVILHLKDDASKYLDRKVMENALKRFSSFVSFPIYLGVKNTDKEVSWKIVNAEKPLWLRDKSEISEEEYVQFYKRLSKDRGDSLGHIHFKGEGDFEFTGLFYVPADNKGGKMYIGDEKQGSDVKLYVQRVLISDSVEDFFPRWLNFLRGVIDSNDLPLKIDRETFSRTKVMRTMKKKSMSKVFELFKSMSREAEKDHQTIADKLKEIDDSGSEKAAEERTKLLEGFPAFSKYARFWDSFGENIVLGCIEKTPSDIKKKILDIFRGSTTYRRGPTTLGEYVSRMLPGQSNIYYLTGDSEDAMMNSPYLEFFIENKIEVLLLKGAFDDGCLSSEGNYKNHKFVLLEKHEHPDDEFAFLEAGDDQNRLVEVARKHKIEQKAINLFYEKLLNWVQDRLGIVKAQYVLMSKSLTRSPAMISSPAHGFTAAHERLARTSLGGNRMMIDAYAAMKNLELNPHHYLIHHLLEEVKFVETHPKDAKRAAALNETIDLIYESSLIASGYPPRRPHLIIEKLYSLMHAQAGKKDASFRLEIPKNIYESVEMEMKAKEKMKKSPDDEDDREDWFRPSFDDDEDDASVKDEL